MPTDSLNIGASGMDAYQAQIDVISNNIANAGTTAYKSQSMTFQDLFYATQQAASGPTKTNGGVNAQQIGIGVKTGSVDTNLNQGGVQTTGVATNMMINGDGYFMLANSDGTGSPSYTRNGDFSLNSNGLLNDPSSGLAVMGFTADSSGAIDATVQPGPIQIPIGLKSQATATGAGIKYGPSTDDSVFDIQYAGNLSSSSYSSAVSNGAVAAGYLASAGTTVYDSLGNSHLLNITFQPVLNGAGQTAMPFQVDNTSGVPVTAATEWAYNYSSTDGTTFSTGTTTSQTAYIYFDAQGNFINTSGTSAPTSPATTLPTTDVHSLGGVPSTADGNQLLIDKWGTPTGGNNATTYTATTGPVGIDLSKMSANGAASAFQMTHQNGYAPGTLSNITVGQDGTITGAFTNGDSQTLARVALAAFQNEGGLEKLGASRYTPSADSGPALIGTANSGRYGAIVGDSLEMSNVSITDEFTKLIAAQNAFTANSKSITTANENLQTVVGLIH